MSWLQRALRLRAHDGAGGMDSIQNRKDEDGPLRPPAVP
jgi:hypothetical protein